jgi:hypothetical protein
VCEWVCVWVHVGAGGVGDALQRAHTHTLSSHPTLFLVCGVCVCVGGCHKALVGTLSENKQSQLTSGFSLLRDYHSRLVFCDLVRSVGVLGESRICGVLKISTV